MFSGYGGYPMTPYQVLGILTFVFAVFLFVIGVLFPIVYYPLALPEGHASLEYSTDDDEDVKKDPSSEEEVEVVEEVADAESPDAITNDTPADVEVVA
jgi:hypothetical protein